MLKERAQSMIQKLQENPTLVQNTLKFTDTLRKDKIQDLNLPITYCSGPIKEKIRAQLLRRAFQSHEKNVQQLAKREQPVLQLLNSLETLHSLLKQPQELQHSKDFSRTLLKKEEQFSKEREFCDFKIKILEKFHSIVNLSEKEKESLFGNPYEISKEQVLAGLYHVGEIKVLKGALLKMKNEEQKKESQLLQNLQKNIQTIESSIETKVFQILKEIFRKKSTPQELMEQSDNLAFVKYGFELAQKGEDRDLYKQLIQKFKSNLTSSIKLEARNIAQISSTGLTKHSNSDFSFLDGDKLQDDEDVKDRYDLEIVNWSDSLSWLYQTSKELSQLLQQTLRQITVIESIQRQVLQNAINALLLEKAAHWKKGIPRGIIKPIYNILCDYNAIITQEAGNFSFILKDLFMEFKKKVTQNFSEVSMRSLVRTFQEYLFLKDTNSKLIFEKSKTEFQEQIQFYHTLNGSEDLFLKELKGLILKNPKEYIYFGFSLLMNRDKSRKVSLEEEEDKEEEKQAPFLKEQISLLQYAMTKISQTEWNELLKQPYLLDVQLMKKKEILNLRKDLLDSLQK